MLTPEKEILILAAVKPKFEARIPNVITDEPLFDSKQDVIDKITVQSVDDKTEVVYCKLSLLEPFNDSDTDGCDDDPLTTPKYLAHVVCEYNPARSDGSSSEKDLKTIALNLHNDFLNKNRTVSGVPGCEYVPLKRASNIILDNDPLTGVYAHYIDLILGIEII
jgi:hypothetical protein